MSRAVFQALPARHRPWIDVSFFSGQRPAVTCTYLDLDSGPRLLPTWKTYLDLPTYLYCESLESREYSTELE